MDQQIQMIIVYIIVFAATFFTWKVIKDFYEPKFHKLITHLIAVFTSLFMFLSTMTLFIPRNYQRGITPEIELNFSSVGIIVIMLSIIYFFFRYLPNKNK